MPRQTKSFEIGSIVETTSQVECIPVGSRGTVVPIPPWEDIMICVLAIRMHEHFPSLTSRQNVLGLTILGRDTAVKKVYGTQLELELL